MSQKVEVSAEAKHQEKDLELARQYADEHPHFEDSFIESLEVYFREHGYITDNQHKALQKIIRSWRMWEWAEESGLL